MALKPCVKCQRLTRAGSYCRACSRASYYRTPEWRRLSTEVVQRDRRCVQCGSTYMLAAHHIVGRADGGPDHPSNLQTLCVRCHGRLEAEQRRT